MRALTLLLLLPRLISACQPECVCLSPSDVSCVASSLTSLPVWQASMSDVTSLDLSLNDVTTLEPDAFLGVRRLETLLLNSNQIRDVDALALSELRHLMRVELEDNVIASLDPDTFIANPVLEALSLSGNPLQLTAHFLYSESVTSVDMSHCALKVVPANAFAGLPQLEILVLSHNALETLPGDLFGDLPGMQRVYLHGNPWRCDDVMLSQRDRVADFQKLRCGVPEATTRAAVEEDDDVDDDDTDIVQGIGDLSYDVDDYEKEGLDILQGKGIGYLSDDVDDDDKDRERQGIRDPSDDVGDDLTVKLLVYMNFALIFVILVSIAVVIVILRKNISDIWLRRNGHQLIQNENSA